MPDWAKWIANFINRVGFPIFAFCILAYFHFVKMDESTKVMKELRDVMIEVKIGLSNSR